MSKGVRVFISAVKYVSLRRKFSVGGEAFLYDDSCCCSTPVTGLLLHIPALQVCDDTLLQLNMTFFFSFFFFL